MKFLSVLICCILLAGCSQPIDALPTPDATALPVIAPSPMAGDYGKFETDTSADGAVEIVLNGSGITAGNGVTVTGSVATIREKGTYRISGSLQNGQVVVDAPDCKVHLILDGAHITCLQSAPLFVANADKVALTLAENSQNTLTDGGSYSFANGEDEPNAALFSKDDLTINGTGTLTVNANYNNGIGGKDDLQILSGTVRVNAKNNGIKGKDSLVISGGTITVTAGGNGLQASNADRADKGYLVIEGGQVSVTAAEDGLEAETSLSITAGELFVSAGGGSNQALLVNSAKALKAGTDLILTGGTVTLDSADDGIHSNRSVYIAGGTFALSSGDDGIHADQTVLIAGGSVSITQAYEGIEGSNVTIEGGEISLVAADDGINAAGGSDSSSLGGRPGQNMFAGGSDHHITIRGGHLQIDAAGDGIDANGKLTIDGGTVFVNGPTDHANGALDSNAGVYVNGGTLVAVGSMGMAETPSTHSKQNVLDAALSGQGDSLTLLDAQGNVLLTFEASKAYQSVILSTPLLQTGQTYTLKNQKESLSLTLSQRVTVQGGTGSFRPGFGGAGPFGQGGGPRP